MTNDATRASAAPALDALFPSRMEAELGVNPEFPDNARDEPSPIRAAEYRMSTDHQRYSTENQAAAIQAYAAQRGMEIVRTYADEGKSGLRIEGRHALKQLIETVTSKSADFDVILVYDISRCL